MLAANEYDSRMTGSSFPRRASLAPRTGPPGAGPQTGASTPFRLTLRTRIFPKRNSTLKGLYESNGILCTQCEAEDFRRITFFPDRPDVLARYTTTIRAARADLPVLLSNGNLVASGKLDDGRHFARWEDPFPKPSYLFALVAGDLACLEDTFTTASGREVALRIYSEPHNIGRCGHAMDSLKKAMRWDEEVYGLEYDLDLYMIVAVDHFNMGAMENKGLNVFNTRYVLADPETATDTDFANVEMVIGHEYFHNWTGNRVTCRDWFQLSLKEGLTVFREQQFSADMGSRGVKRIRDARLIRDRQFKEDGGPDAHPVRPQAAYREINNFYTVTIYHKGAEVIRMMHTLLGPEGFRRGMDLYLARHDGSAATTDDFVSAMEDGAGADLARFRRWYSQAGTPVLQVEDDYDPEARTWSLRVRQELPPTPDGSPTEPVHLPLAVGLVARDGRGSSGRSRRPGGNLSEDGTMVLDLREPEERFVFREVDAPPVVSVLRGFSAPVRIAMERPDEDLVTLLTHDPDPFARWDAGQTLALARLDRLIEAGGAPGPHVEAADSTFVEAMRAVLRDRSIDGAFAAEAPCPAVRRLPRGPDGADRRRRRPPTRAGPCGARSARPSSASSGRSGSGSALSRTYRFDADGAARRALSNACLGYLAATESPAARRECLDQFLAADNMTDAIAALGCLARHRLRGARRSAREVRGALARRPPRDGQVAHPPGDLPAPRDPRAGRGAHVPSRLRRRQSQPVPGPRPRLLRRQPGALPRRRRLRLPVLGGPDARDRSPQPRGGGPPRGGHGPVAPPRRRAARPDGGGHGVGTRDAGPFPEHRRGARPDPQGEGARLKARLRRVPADLAVPSTPARRIDDECEGPAWPKAQADIRRIREAAIRQLRPLRLR